MDKLQELKSNKQAPEWLTTEGYKTLENGYLLPGETPNDLYRRVSASAAKRLSKPELENKFYDYISKNWLCLATPVAANMGAERGLPISCYSNHVDDNTFNIFNSYTEMAMLIKHGGGIGTYWGDVRGRGAPIKGGGASEGIVPWLKITESIATGVAQSGTRRGAIASYLPIRHLDAAEFIDIRRQTGDMARRCLSVNFHHGVIIDDQFMNEMLDGNVKNRELWQAIIKARVETGEPYIMFSDNANNHLPEAYVKNDLKVSTSNLCSEIFLHTDKDHTFVCCLSSLNLARYDEWKDSDLIETAIYFLDAVMEEFIIKASNLSGFEKAVRFAIKSRALGLGVLGWHTYLQSKMVAFDSFEAMRLNAEIFKLIKEKSYAASRELAKEYGEPEWCKGTGMRNTHTMAIAPTVSNSLISGGVSQGIEPIVANLFAQKSAKGTFIRKNPILEKYLESIGKNTDEVWQQISLDSGSVKNVKGLSKDVKEVFLTARELDQHAIIRQAGQRQKYIDQGQSVNLFFSVPKDFKNEEEKKLLTKYIHDVHVSAWQSGLKSLYYSRIESALRGDLVYRSQESDCKACEA
jgi:ribonucleoside-diphosphate reductase alpha chain